jgi:hypothetical protein
VTAAVKPIGRKAYGSIAHLPMSRMGPGDHHCHAGQARICTEASRDRHDRIIVQEKLDGSNVAVALKDGVLHPIGRAGWPAISSKYEMHHLFAQWAWANEERFRAVLREGERVCGEWLAQAHGTIYDLRTREPFAAFDIMTGDQRLPFDAFRDRVNGIFSTPTLLHDGGPISVTAAMDLHAVLRWPCDEVEGVVYRVERKGVVDFLAKYVRPDKVDGKYLSGEPVWLWRPAACLCGCGADVGAKGSLFLRGHNLKAPAFRRKRLPLPLCACGCGERVKRPRFKFLRGHWAKANRPTNAPHRPGPQNPLWNGYRDRPHRYEAQTALGRPIADAIVGRVFADIPAVAGNIFVTASP